jgi:DNA-binding beta-propeller fold protein YncE
VNLAVIADGLNGRVRRVDVQGVITTIARLRRPLGVAVDPEGAIYVAEADENRISKIG